MKSPTFFKLFFLAFLFFPPFLSHAATLSLSPSAGTFSVGSTFEVSILLDTNGKSINALSVSLSFPPDLLQIVSPSTGQSVIGVWTATPKFDNLTGRIDLQGGVPGGITASKALVSTVTFRVKSVGEAIIKFLDNSKVLLNDGLGTNALTQTGNGLYEFKLPAPAGPALASETNPDQATWYSSRTVSFRFASEAGGVEGFSYVLSEDPTTIPDDISEGKKNTVSYTDLSDGVHYFHIKSLRDGSWGGTTHYAVKIDTAPPSDFKIDIAPSARTTSKQPIIQFSTTDSLSGIDHYDLKLVPLGEDSGKTEAGSTGRFFIESTSPYVPPELALGAYDVIVRAYDKSNNYREVTSRLVITTGLLSFINTEAFGWGTFSISWLWFWILALLLVGGLSYSSYRVYTWRRRIHRDHQEKKLPDNIAKQLDELRRYRARYGNKIIVILFALASFSLFAPHGVHAETAELAPPLVTTISKDISNEEIFYIGGKTDFANETVIIYLQNLSTGETFSQNMISDDSGNWFYRHGNPLPPGSYRLWVQSRLKGEFSPPGPQIKMTVNRTAIEFGGRRVSYEDMYLYFVIILSCIIVTLGIFIVYHYYHGKKKHLELKKQTKETKESVRMGFAILRRDILAELSVIKKAKLKKPLTEEEKAKETELLADLEEIEKHIGKDILDIETFQEKAA